MNHQACQEKTSFIRLFFVIQYLDFRLKYTKTLFKRKAGIRSGTHI